MEKFGYRLKRFYTSKVWLGTEEGKMVRLISLLGVLGLPFTVVIPLILNAPWLFFLLGFTWVVIVGSTPLVLWIRWFGTRGRMPQEYRSDEYWEPLEQDEESQEA